jgi:hypothetical protein
MGKVVQVVFDEKGGVPGIDFRVEAGMVVELMVVGWGIVVHGLDSSSRPRFGDGAAA